MLKKRIIPILTSKHLSLVKTKSFNSPRTIGNPIQSARVFSSRYADELVFVDIYAGRENRNLDFNLIEFILKECDMPLTVGGGIKEMKTVDKLFKIGADKLLIRSQAYHNEDFINSIIEKYGRQSVIIALDCFRDKKNRNFNVYVNSTQYIPIKKALNSINSIKPGEVCITSVDKEGHMKGMDVELLKFCSDKLTIPIIFNGGIGKPSDASEPFMAYPDLSAIAASSIFQYTQHTISDIRQELINNNILTRRI